MQIGKVSSAVIGNAAKKVVKSPFVKGGLAGATAVTVADIFKKRNEEKTDKQKMATAAITATVVGGAALLFLAGKSAGASNKQALKTGVNMVKDGVKALFNQAKATPVGQKISGAISKATGKAKEIISKVKSNPKVQAAAEKAKTKAAEIKNSPKIQEAGAKVKDVAGKAKTKAAEVAKKAKGAAVEKGKELFNKAKSALSNLFNKAKDAPSEMALLP